MEKVKEITKNHLHKKMPKKLDFYNFYGIMSLRMAILLAWSTTSKVLTLLHIL